MATLNVKNLPDALYRKLRDRARRQHRSILQEVVHLLSQALDGEASIVDPGAQGTRQGALAWNGYRRSRRARAALSGTDRRPRRRPHWARYRRLHLLRRRAHRVPGARRAALRRPGRRGWSAVTSTLTLLETLVVPYRAGDTALAERYEALLSRSRGLRLVELDRPLLRAAAHLRAAVSVKTPTPSSSPRRSGPGAPRFLRTNDRDLPPVPGIRILRPPRLPRASAPVPATLTPPRGHRHAGRRALQRRPDLRAHGNALRAGRSYNVDFNLAVQCHKLIDAIGRSSASG